MPSLVVITSSNMGLGAVLEYPSQFSFDNCPQALRYSPSPACSMAWEQLSKLLQKESCWDPFSLNPVGHVVGEK